jgi:DNA helicase-2/ATP-dependent DNA helicase PcrA
VLAGAGTGKTRVITHRIVDLVKEGIDPKRILAVTFTNKAAKEMRHRLGKMGIEEGSWISTFHATGLRILRMHADQVGYEKNFTIYDDDAQKNLVKALLADVDTGRLKIVPGLVHSYIGDLKGNDIGWQDIAKSTISPVLQPVVQEVYRKYEEALLRSNAMDFADLLVNTVKLLRRGQDTPQGWLLRRFAYVLVDEFQDTNAIQMEMIDLLATDGEICVVGDDDQSIYGWRGADPKGMMRFAKRPGTELVKLEENYRCTAPILDCANALIANNSGRIGKTLRANKQGCLVRVSRVMDERAEARHLAQTIQKRPVFGDYAVLYRTHAQSRAIEEAFRHAAVPYTIIGGLRFYDRAEIKDLLAFFRLAVNPKADMDLLRVANKPTRGMGAKKMGQLKMAAAKHRKTMYETLKDSTEPAHQNLYEMLTKLRKARHGALGLLDFYDAVLNITEYRSALVNTVASSKSKAQQEKAQARMENVDELATDCSTYADQHPGATVDDYLEHVALVSSVDKDAGPVVSLMTIHAAKGLEFPHVFLVGFEEKLLPHVNSIKATEKAKLEGTYSKEDDPIEEERRLAYVAITRAKDELDITLTDTRQIGAKWESMTPSRFFAELPAARLQKAGI